PDTALERTNQKFSKRFQYLEQQAQKIGKTLHEMSLDAMEVIWQEAKKAD
ncbi:nucleoside triphosphate pyrophosphohydrolase, partial [Flavobacteriaceae bacterium]|nr:nucleoside triphosphate pyrophosphohydrolase [Flavobacteriaceae bacterium]